MRRAAHARLKPAPHECPLVAQDVAIGILVETTCERFLAEQAKRQCHHRRIVDCASSAEESLVFSDHGPSRLIGKLAVSRQPPARDTGDPLSERPVANRPLC